MEQALKIPDNASYQLQYRKCGKASCRTCQRGQGHGPYWYAYWKDGKKVRSQYVGKEHPDVTQREDKEEMPALSPNDVRIVRWLAEGKTFSAIADRLKISEHTVGNYVWRAMRRLGFTKNIQLTIYALKTGLIRLEDIELSWSEEDSECRET